MSPESNSRRNFVKKSIVTTIVLAQPTFFSGLVRATGGEGDTTGGATTAPETTWVYETTFPWTDGFETTIPCAETTDPGTATHPPGYESTVPVSESTVPETCYTTDIQTTKHHCPAHGDSCTWVKKIAVVFTGVGTHLEPNDPERSGDIYVGKLTYTLETCDGTTSGTTTTTDVTIDVSSGGYLVEETDLALGSQTAIPAGSYNMSATQKATGDLHGYAISPDPAGRSDLFVHKKARPFGSSGCIAMKDANSGGEWDTFKNAVNNGNVASCVHNPPRPIPMTVAYQGITAPTYTWKPGKSH